MLQSWTFQRKVRAGFGVMVALAVLTAGVSMYALREVVTNKDAVINTNAEGLVDAARLEEEAARQASGFRGFLASPEDRFLQERNSAQKDFADVLRRVRGKVYTEQGMSLLKNIEALQGALNSAQERGIAARLGPGGAQAAARLFDEEVLPQRDRLVREIKAFRDLKQRLLDEAESQSAALASLLSFWVLALACGAVVFAGITAYLLGRTLSRQIGSAVLHVQSSSAELQTSASQQASGAKETATAMSEVSTTMSELLATSRQIAESAQQVAHIAEQTAGAARSGDQTVAQAQPSIEAIRRQVNAIVGHMLDLGRKSQSIGGVLDIINELAEQTNILSINATIEAAGAGEQGKRFAVVGDEIRKLADRTAGSTREIRTLVEEIRGAVNTTVLATESGSKSVDAGLQQFEEVTRVFKQIGGLVVTTTQAAREIELSTKQQMTAVEQATAAISGAAQASRENESSSTQTLQTATQLAHLSHDLALIVQSPAHA